MKHTQRIAALMLSLLLMLPTGVCAEEIEEESFISEEIECELSSEETSDDVVFEAAEAVPDEAPLSVALAEDVMTETIDGRVTCILCGPRVLHALSSADDDPEWTSDNARAASVNGAGVITVHPVTAPQYAVITATLGDAAAKICLKVLPAPQSVEVASVAPGSLITLYDAPLTYDVQLSPNDAMGDLGVRVDPEGIVSARLEAGKLTLTPKGDGAARVTVFLTEDPDVALAFCVAHGEGYNSISIRAVGGANDRYGVRVGVGKKLNLQARYVPGHVDGAALHYRSRNKKIATVDANGTVKGVKKGTTYIDITSDDAFIAPLTVRVTVAAPITAVKLDFASMNTIINMSTGTKQLALLAKTKPAFGVNVADGAMYIWSSSDESVATVADGVVSAVGEGTCVITCRANDGSGKTAKKTISVGKQATSFEVYSASGADAVLKGGKLKLNVRRNAGALDGGVIWIPLDPNIAKVSDDGVVTGLKTGSTSILAIDKLASLTSTIDIAVMSKRATGLALDKTAVSFDFDDPTDERCAIGATVKGPLGMMRKLIVTSSDESVATATVADPKIENKFNITVRKTGARGGSCTITVMTPDGAFKKTCRVTVHRRADALYPLTPESVNLLRGKKTTLRVGMAPEDSTDAVTWTSDDPTLAKVSSNGVVTASTGKSGTTTVTAQIGADADAARKVHFTVRVLAKATTSVKLTAPEKTLRPWTDETGTPETLKLTATVSPAGASDALIWTSSDPAVATVGENGVVTPVIGARGNVTITAMATDGSGKKGTFTVFVETPARSIKIFGNDDHDARLVLPVGKSFALSCRAIDENGADRSHDAGYVTYRLAKSSYGSYISVSAGGVVKAKRAVSKPVYVECMSFDGGTVATIPVVVLASSKAAGAVSIKGAGTVVEMGKTCTLTATATKTPVQSFAWSCDGAELTAENNTATLTCTKLGEVTVTALVRDGSNKRATLRLTVVPPITGIRVLGAHSVAVGKTTRLSAAVLPAASSAMPVTWMTDDAAIVRLDPNTGAVKGLKPGVAYVRAVAGDATSAPFVVRVSPPADTLSIFADGEDVTNRTVNAYADYTDHIQLTARARSGGVIVNSAVKWRSLDPKLATVDENGVVRFASGKTGTVTITATCTEGGDLTAKFGVCCKRAVLAIDDPPYGVLALGCDMPLTCRVYEDGRLCEDASALGGLEWLSEDPELVTVDPITGVVHCADVAGDNDAARITVRSKKTRELKDTIRVQVYRSPGAIAFLGIGEKVSVPLSQKIYGFAVDCGDDLPNDVVGILSSDVSVAVCEGSILRLKKPGTVIITARLMDGTNASASFELTVEDA